MNSSSSALVDLAQKHLDQVIKKTRWKGSCG